MECESIVKVTQRLGCARQVESGICTRRWRLHHIDLQPMLQLHYGFELTTYGLTQHKC